VRRQGILDGVLEEEEGETDGEEEQGHCEGQGGDEDYEEAGASFYTFSTVLDGVRTRRERRETSSSR